MKLIPLSRGMFAEVDDCDFESLSQHKWYATSNGKGFRACRDVGGREDKKHVYMHHEILPKIDGMHVDHINGNSLDNKRQNLRYASVKQNIRNSRKQQNTTSSYKGVCWYKNRWVASITVDRKSIYLGRFVDEIEAANAYKEASLKYFGEFSRTPGV